MIEHRAGELLADKVELDVEGIDPLYLNAYQPRLQTGGGVVGFFREHRGAVVASTTGGVGCGPRGVVITT
jgi:hypothetical protein